MKDILLNYLKTLKVVPRKTEKGAYRIVYAPRALRIGLVDIKPKPTKEEIEEAINWLEENKLAIPVCDGVLEKLVNISDVE
jgi:hypothetical protein